MQSIPAVHERPTGRVPTTAVTNELARAVIGLSPVMRTGATDFDPRDFGFWPLKVESYMSPVGVYRVIIGRWQARNAPTANVKLFSSGASMADFTADEVAHHWGYLYNIGEEGWSAGHRLGIGQAFFGWRIPGSAADGLPVFYTNYQRAVRDLRENPTNGDIEVTYEDSDVPTTWVEKIHTTTCSSTPTAQLMQFMMPGNLK